MKYLYILMLILLLPTTHTASAADSPKARFGATMFYDSVNQRMLLFGGGTQGAGGSTFFNDMWSYDYATDTWTEIQTENAPHGDYGPPAAYDPDTKRLYLIDNEGSMWTFNVENDTWVKLGPSGISPWRGMTPLVYDGQYKKIILFSGMTGNPTGDRFPTDTWVYDPKLDRWESMSPSSAPGGRYGHSFVYDPVGERTLMVGGHNWTSTTPRKDYVTEGVWSYDYGSDAWSKLDPSSAPTHRYWHAYSINTDTGELMVFGGVDIESFLTDTWIFGEEGWRQITSESSPKDRELATAAYDPINKVTLLFGGEGYENGQPIQFNDLWALDSNGNWRQLTGEGEATTPHEETSITPEAESGSIPAYPIGAILIAIIASLKIQRRIFHRI